MGGFGANHHLRQSLVFLDVPVLQQPEAYIGGVATLFDEAGEITNESTKAFDQLGQMLSLLDSMSGLHLSPIYNQVLDVWRGDADYLSYLKTVVKMLPGGSQVALPYDISGYADERQYNVQLQQSVFSWLNWKSLSRAHKEVAKAEADYKAAQESLIQRVATAYFNVLAAQDTVDADQAALTAVTQSLEQANKRYDVGLIPITDVKEAQAAHDSDAAAVIEAKRQLASVQQALREITDQDYPTLSKPGEDMALNPPQPADIDHWVQISMDQNVSLLSSRLAADVARESVEISRSGHLPTLAITAQRGVQNEDLNQNEAFGGPAANIRYPQSANSNVGLIKLLEDAAHRGTKAS